MMIHTEKWIHLVICLSTFFGFNFSPFEPSFAQSANFMFQATVEPRCEFQNLTGGSLSLSGDRLVFSTVQESKAKLECNTPTKIKVETPEQIAGPNLNPIALESKVLILGNNCQTNQGKFTETIISNQASPVAESAIENSKLRGCHNLNVSMKINNSAEITSGTYIFMVRVTAIQN